MLFFNSLFNVFKEKVNEWHNQFTSENIKQIQDYNFNLYDLDSLKRRFGEESDIIPFIYKFFEISKNKNELIKNLDDIKNFYFTQMIIDRLTDDVINPATDDNTVFEVVVKKDDEKDDETLTELLNEFIKKYNIQNVIRDITPDLLLYGNYALRLNTETKKGIVNIHDDVDISKIIPIYKDSQLSGFIIQDDNKILLEQPTSFVYFSLLSSRIRIQTEAIDDKVTYLRMGKSVLYSVYSLLRELRFLEALIPIQFINQAVAKKIISISMASNTTPEMAKKIVDTYQKLINNTILNKEIANMTDDQILQLIQNNMTDVKVIPNFGDKGELSPVDLEIPKNFEDLYEKIHDLRNTILSTIGFPNNFMDENISRADMIKENTRYAKKLKQIQYSIIDGLQHLFLIHLHTMGYTNVVKDSIVIRLNDILDMQDLEMIEYLDILISQLDNFKSFVTDVRDIDDEHINLNVEKVVEFYNEKLKIFTKNNLFEYKEGGGDEEDDY